MMYVKEYYCLQNAYEWKLFRIYPVQFLGERDKFNHFLNLDDLDVDLFWVNEYETEDTSSDYFCNWTKKVLFETTAQIILYWNCNYERIWLNVPYPKLKTGMDNPRMKRCLK